MRDSVKSWFNVGEVVFLKANAKGELPTPEPRTVVKVTNKRVEFLLPDGRVSDLDIQEKCVTASTPREFCVMYETKVIAFYEKHR